jgi:hypothetical protein
MTDGKTSIPFSLIAPNFKIEMRGKVDGDALNRLLDPQPKRKPEDEGVVVHDDDAGYHHLRGVPDVSIKELARKPVAYLKQVYSMTDTDFKAIAAYQMGHHKGWGVGYHQYQYEEATRIRRILKAEKKARKAAKRGGDDA